MTEDKNDSNEGCLQGCLQSIKSFLYNLFISIFTLFMLGVIVLFFILLMIWSTIILIRFFGWIFGFFGWIFSVSIWLGIVISIISIIPIIVVGIFVYLIYDAANSDDNALENVTTEGIQEGVTNIFIYSRGRVDVFVSSIGKGVTNVFVKSDHSAIEWQEEEQSESLNPGDEI